jgi:hypothetical protein
MNIKPSLVGSLSVNIVDEGLGSSLAFQLIGFQKSRDSNFLTPKKNVKRKTRVNKE